MNIKEIEKKWQQKWEEEKIYKFDPNSKNKKLYCLEMFSYPSGAKLHMGHWWNYGVTDSWARLKKMQGYNVFHPMGFDAFGLPAENYAIKTGIHPMDSTNENIKTMKKQLKEIGATYDWDYEINTSSPEYYKWTQWMFLKLYENDLAYKKLAPVNFCPSCNTVLANEQVVNGTCERCGTTVIRKEMNQWFFRITNYAEELLKDLDNLNWPEVTKTLQRNWIGKSHGTYIDFKIDNTDYNFKVFTTRPDTIYGVTYCVLSPEHKLVDLITPKEYQKKVKNYQAEASRLSEIDRTSTIKEKTGVFTGAYAINPINNQKVPIWIADYVLSTYGTGAVMAVPAHDERDYDFACKYNLEIKPIIKSETIPYTLDGIHINSPLIDGLNIEKSSIKINKYLEDKDLGKEGTTYKLRDWLVSRQRYWGCPIPIIYCDKCGIVPVPEKNLPVLLPYDVEFTPDGESPLLKSKEFMNVKCPKCGCAAKREADTLDTFVCSSWYYLRYPDAKNTQKPFNKEIVNKLLPVDKYVGGIEHAVMHLLYARFFTKALRDMGYLDFDEPFTSLIHQGIILGPDGEKMSKSRGNTISPDHIVDKYGSDILRNYLMFGFNYIDGGPWTDDGIISINKFYNKVIRLVKGYKEINKEIPKLEKSLHNTIKNVTKDVDNFQFNTSLARIMEYTNNLTLYEKEGIPKYYLEQLVLLLAPFAPHITEELWCNTLNNKFSVHNMEYPKYNKDKIKEEYTEIGVQVNGKLRASIKTNDNMSEEEIKKLALNEENIKKYTQNKEIIKIIIIPKRIVSIVLK